MNRIFAFVAALVAALLSVSSACTAAPVELVQFTLEAEGPGGERVQATFRDQQRGRNEGQWTDGFRTADLVGLDPAGFRAGGTRPVHFALIREAGRLDCSGSGGGSRASGSCGFTLDPAFTRLLESRNIARPTRDQAFGLMALNVRRDLVEALAAARYPTPSIDDLIALSALGANGGYISQLAQAGYRPSTINSLIEFKALGITPAWISGFARIGYANLPSDQLVELKALGITPEFVMGFERLGYGRLPVRSLVELKALGITPAFARTVVRASAPLPPVEKLVELKLFSGRR